MARTVDAVTSAEGGRAVDLAVRAVAYWAIPGAPGIVTGEPPEVQGLRRGPHLAQAAGVHPADGRAWVRVRMPAPDVVRVTVVAGRPWAPDDDGDRWGMVVEPHATQGAVLGSAGGRQVPGIQRGSAVAVQGASPGAAARGGTGGTDGADRSADRGDPSGTASGDAGGGSAGGGGAGGTGGAARMGQPARGLATCTELHSAGGGVCFDHSPLRWRLLGPGEQVLARSGGDVRQAMGAPLAPALSFGPGWMGCSLALAPGELLAGLGEQAGPVTRNGQRVVVAVDDALGTGTGRTYKAVPVLHSSAGYSLFVHAPGPVTVDAGATHADVLTIRSAGDVLDLFLFTGPTVADRLARYTELTGRPTVVPRWALGVWMSRCRYRDRHELMQAARGMRDHNVGCDVVHLDPSWLVRDVLSCDFEWSRERFGDPGDLVEELAGLALRLSLWELPYLDPDSPVATAAAAAGLLVRDRSGQPAEVVRTFARDGRPRWLVDFTDPAARQWWAGLHRPLLDAGVAVFTTDFGEGLPDDAVLAASTPEGEQRVGTSGDGERRPRAGGDATGPAGPWSWANLYPLWYNRTVLEAVTDHGGEPALVLGRSGWAGSQRYPGQWSGDAESTPAGMAGTLRAGLSWAVSAPGLWAHDVGGFSGGDPLTGPSPALYVRWAQFGCLSPLTRFHGLTPREPWAFGEEALSIVRRFVDIRYRLLPYLESAVRAAAATGLPVLRPMVLEMEDVPAAWHADGQYLLGPDLLVVPVPSDDAGPVAVPVLVPPGRWVDVLSGDAATGPTVVRRTVGLDRLPLLVRAGAVVPTGPPAQSTMGLARGSWVLHLWPGPYRSTTVHDPAGLCHYRPADLRGREPVAPAEVEAIVVEEPVARAVEARCHLPDGTVRSLRLLR